MKSVLMIAYCFPPEGNAGVYRPLRFLRNLPAYGWRGRVVSARRGQFERYDPDLLGQVPDGTEIVRVADGDLWQTIQRKRGARLGRNLAKAASGAARQETGADGRASRNTALRSRVRDLVRKAESCWYHPDVQKSWIRPAVEATVAMCAGVRPDVLWATGPPWSAFIVARQASRRTGIPYVLDFRTSWTIVPSPFEAMRPGWAQRRDRRVLHELLGDAQAVTFFYEAEAECFWRLYKASLDPSRIHIIPNGFDGEVEEGVLPPGDRFTILYTGTLADYRYQTFLDALRIFKQREPGQAGRLSVQFVGEGVEDVAHLARLLNIADIVSTAPPVPHSEIHRLQRHAHALLMFERIPTKGYELLAGAKLFGYLKVGRPILGVVPEGEATRVLRDVGVSTIADPESPERICAVVETMMNVWSAGQLSALVPDRAACERYSGKAQTSALVRALEGLPPAKEFVPGVVDIVPSLRAEFTAEGWA